MKDCRSAFPRMPVLCPCILQVCKNTSLLSYYNRASCIFLIMHYLQKEVPNTRLTLQIARIAYKKYHALFSSRGCAHVKLASNFYARKPKQQQSETKQTRESLLSVGVLYNILQAFFVSIKSLYSVSVSKVRKAWKWSWIASYLLNLRPQVLDMES